uniref:Sorting nexin 16 n=1 Tax=Dicentrarchus labrax TaxID=13489 RepID=A0A8P4GKM3_DICLA
MASPFVPVPVPMDRALSGGSGKLRRPQRASSLGSVSSSSSCFSIPRAAGEDHGRGCGASGSQHQSRRMDRGGRSRTPPPLQSPVARAMVNGTLEPSIEYSSCPRSISDPVGNQQGEERPITPTVLGYEVMEERAKFTAFCETLEESNYRLQKELLEKQKEIASLKRRLEEKEQAILRLEKHINGECVSPESLCDLSAQGSESSADADVESSAAEADQDMPDDTGSAAPI